MKNFKIISVILVIAIIAYIDDPQNFSLNDETTNSQIMQSGTNANKDLKDKNPEKSFFRDLGFKKSTKTQSSTHQGQRMTITSCIQRSDRILAIAFMLPPGWKVQCDTQYKLQGKVLWGDSLFKAHKTGSSIELFNEPSNHYLYDENLIKQMLNSVNMPEYGYLDQGRQLNNFKQQVLDTYPKAIDLVQFATQDAPAIVQKDGYQIYHISRDPIANSVKILAKSNKVEVNAITIITHAIGNPNKIKMMKMIQPIIYSNQNSYSWHLLSFAATGNKSDEKEMSELLNMSILTAQENPRFTQFVAKVNHQLVRQTIRGIQDTYTIRKRTYDEINTIMMNTYKNKQISSDRSQSNWVDGMLEVESYTNTTDGTQYKMPSSNDYYYTNNMNDYIGTNNPLLDPNIGLNSLYNWQKLEKTKG